MNFISDWCIILKKWFLVNVKKKRKMVLFLDFVSVCVFLFVFFILLFIVEEFKLVLYDVKVMYDRE